MAGVAQHSSGYSGRISPVAFAEERNCRTSASLRSFLLKSRVVTKLEQDQ
jgi:hypothetical protein